MGHLWDKLENDNVEMNVLGFFFEGGLFCFVF